MLTQGPAPDPKCKIVPYTSTFIRMSHLYQECHVHRILFTNGWGDGIGGGGSLYL